MFLLTIGLILVAFMMSWSLIQVTGNSFFLLLNLELLDFGVLIEKCLECLHQRVLEPNNKNIKKEIVTLRDYLLKQKYISLYVMQLASS